MPRGILSDNSFLRINIIHAQLNDTPENLNIPDHLNIQ